VVVDSDPEVAYEETRQKARALFRAAEEEVEVCGGKREKQRNECRPN